MNYLKVIRERITVEDRNFKLLTKMYEEFSKKFDNIDKRFDGVDNEIKDLKNDVIRLENKLDSNSKALFDGYHQTYEKVCTVENKVDKLTLKVEKQDVEIKVIKGIK